MNRYGSPGALRRAADRRAGYGPVVPDGLAAVTFVRRPCVELVALLCRYFVLGVGYDQFSVLDVEDHASVRWQLAVQQQL